MVESVEAAQPAPAPESSPSSPRKPPKRKTSDLSFPIESKRPKSATKQPCGFACKHVGTSRDALVQREPEDAHTLPSDVLRMRKEHQERRVQYLVELAQAPWRSRRSRGETPIRSPFLSAAVYERSMQRCFLFAARSRCLRC